MTARLRWLERRTGLRLSTRIALTFAAGALFVSVGVAVSAYLYTSSFLVTNQQRATLRQTYGNAEIVRARLSAPGADIPDLLDTLTVGVSTNGVVYSGGRWYSSSLLVSRDQLPVALRRAVLNGQVMRGWISIGHDPQIAVGVPLPAVNGAYFQVYDETSLSHTLSVLLRVLIAASAATTAAGASIGWMIGRRMTAPIRAVAAATERLAQGNLHLQLPAERDRDLGGLVDRFNSMVTSLRNRIESDARFAADVSHELRSPLTTIATSLSVVRNRRAELSGPGRDALDLVTSEFEHFERLVEDLLDISRTDSLDLNSQGERVRVGDLLTKTLENSEYADVQLRVAPADYGAVVVGDKRRLQQALRNLLDNAATHANGATQLGATADATTVTIFVDDDGAGVPVGERERIFLRFTRGSNAARRGSRGGTGLGLALVAGHAQAHGGHASVTDAPSGGARFVVQLPRAGQ